MSYTPNTWETGDVITAEKLNNLENRVLIAKVDQDPPYDEQAHSYRIALDKTWKEIHDAFLAGVTCLVERSNSEYGEDYWLVCGIDRSGDSSYMIIVSYDVASSATYIFETDSENGYPYYDEPE